MNMFIQIEFRSNCIEERKRILLPHHEFIRHREANRGTNQVSNSSVSRTNAPRNNRPASPLTIEVRSRRSYGMIDGKSRPGKRAAGLGPGYVVCLINTGAPVPVTFLGYRERSPLSAVVCDLQIRIC